MQANRARSLSETAKFKYALMYHWYECVVCCNIPLFALTPNDLTHTAVPQMTAIRQELREGRTSIKITRTTDALAKGTVVDNGIEVGRQNETICIDCACEQIGIIQKYARKSPVKLCACAVSEYADNCNRSL